MSEHLQNNPVDSAMLMTINRVVIKEIMNNFSFQKNLVIIDPEMTVRFPKSDICFKKKTAVSPELKRFKPWFDFLGKKTSFLQNTLILGAAMKAQGDTAGRQPL